MAKNASVSALLKPKASVGRNSFPLDQKHVYSQKAGQITPVKALHFIPNDFFKIQAHDFTMTFPMNTAAFLRGRKETAFYSVYYNAVWSLYNQYMATRRDPKTSGLTTTAVLNEPRVSLLGLRLGCFQQYFYYFLYKHCCDVAGKLHSESSFASVSRDLLLSSRVTNILAGWRIYTGLTESVNVPLNDLTDYYDSENLISNYLFKSLAAPDGRTSFSNIALDIVGHSRVFSWIRKLDMLGYGNVYPFFEIAERSIQGIVAKVGVESEISTFDGFLQACRYAFNQLLTSILDCSCTYTVSSSSPRTVTVTQHKYVNCYALCAYNLVFYHFFRNSYYDLDYEPNDFNLDFAYQRNYTAPSGIISLSNFSYRFLDIEYHQWKKDLFTAVLPDTQFGAVSSLSINIDPETTLAGAQTTGVTGNGSGRWTARNGALTAEGLYLDTNKLVGTDSSLNTTEVLHSHAYSGSIDWSNVSGEVANAIDVIAIKRAELLQDYRQTLMRAGNKTSDIFKAIYGGAPSSEHEDDIIPIFLETFGEDLFVDPVQATATTGQASNGELGDLSARGKFRGDSKSFKFNAGNNFGLILVLSYIVPEAEYNSYMLDKHNLELTPEAHYLPTYENWGLEPIFSDELNDLLPMSEISSLGFAPRYYHKKQAVDQVHGAFVSMNLVNSVNSFAVYGNTFVGEFNHWVAPRTDLQNRNISLLRDFYINPSVLDNVFVRVAGADIADDQFICNTYLEIASTRGLSKVGLLNFV